MSKKDNLILELVNETEILGKPIRMYGSVEAPLFLASDVADWIDYAKNPNGSRQTSKMVKNIDEDEKLVVKLLPPGDIQARECTVLTEDGLYEVCMRSTKPIAKQMKKEIKLYLKRIRLTGGAVQINREDEFIDKYFPSFSEETKLAMVQDLRKQNAEQQQIIKELQPQAQAYKDLMDAEGCLKFIDVAAIVETGRNTLLGFLRSCKVITKQSNYNVPYRKYIDNGMFRVIATSVNGHISNVTMVTAKGLGYIYKLMKKKNALDDFNTDALYQKIQELKAVNA